LSVSLIRFEAAKKAAARIAKDRKLQADAAIIVLRAERRLGQLVQSAHEIGQLGLGRPKNSNLTMSELKEKHVPEESDSRSGQDGQPLGVSRDAENNGQNSRPFRVTLKEAGVDKYLSSRAQKWARMGDADFTAKLEDERNRIESIGATPINGARTVNAGRKEPSTSLDFFPTGPWGTRTVIEDVIKLPREVMGTLVAWDPACGEGHMTGVLEEYFGTVIGTDIHDYSAEGRSAPAWGGVLDFLSDDDMPEHLAENEDVDWIITNSPFSGEIDRVLAFALRSLRIAKRGVAMLVRTQVLEGVGRYEQLYRDQPPTIIAQFVERCPLHRGRWEPDGDTMSQYCWLVWIKGEAPRPFFWIPPGRRVERTKPDDVERFTAHPVLPLAAGEVPAQDSGGNEAGSHGIAPSDKSEAALPASEDANANDDAPGVELGNSSETGGESAASEVSAFAGATMTAKGPDSMPADQAKIAPVSSPALADQIPVAASLGAGEGGGEAALPHSEVPVDQLTKDQQNEIIRAGYTRVPKVTAIELMLFTGLKRSTIEMRAKAMDLTAVRRARSRRPHERASASAAARHPARRHRRAGLAVAQRGAHDGDRGALGHRRLRDRRRPGRLPRARDRRVEAVRHFRRRPRRDPQPPPIRDRGRVMATRHLGSASRAEKIARYDAFEEGVCHAIDELRMIAEAERLEGRPGRADEYADKLERNLFTKREAL
jgi:hypothetical protein